MSQYSRNRNLLFSTLTIISIIIQCCHSVPATEQQQQQQQWVIGDTSSSSSNFSSRSTIAEAAAATKVIQEEPSLSSQSSSYFKYETCTWFYRGNPSNCGTYFQCNFGQPLLRDCPAGLFWNSDVLTCDWPHNVRGVGTECQDTRQQPEQTGFVDGENGQEGEDTVIIEGEEIVRTTCTDGEFRSYPNDCSSYYQCNHGILIKYSCPGGLNWNQNQKICDWPQNAGCASTSSGSSGTPAPSPTTPTPTTASPPIVASPTTPTTALPSPVSPVQPSSGTSSGYKVICYFTDWSWYRQGVGKYSPPNIDPTLCTNIIYAFALLDKNNFIIRTADSWADIDNKFYQQVTDLKKTHQVKVSIALGGWNDSEGGGYSTLVNSPGNRARFITSVVEFIKKYNFDGIDLDWEYPKCWQGDCSRGPASDKAAFASFIRELRQALPQGALLSAAVSASKTIIEPGYDVPTLAQNLDWIGVMDYDFHGSWDRKTGHIAPLYFTQGDDFNYFNLNYSINYWLAAGAPAKKLIAGIPLYGQTFTLANSQQKGLNAPSSGPGAAGQFTRQAGVLSYYEICSQSWTQVVQNPQGTMGPYAYKDNQWVSYDDVNFVKIKSDYIKSHQLGGAMVWALDFDDFGNTCGQGKYPLLTAISNKLKS